MITATPCGLRKHCFLSPPHEISDTLAAGKFTPVHDAWWAAARKAAGETAGQPAPDTVPAVTAPVASLTARRLEKLPPDTRPLPSVAAYGQLLRRNRAAQEGTRP